MGGPFGPFSTVTLPSLASVSKEFFFYKNGSANFRIFFFWVLGILPRGIHFLVKSLLGKHIDASTSIFNGEEVRSFFLIAMATKFFL